MARTMHRTAEIVVGLPADQAIALFTPEGERRWADGWDPEYPQPSRREGPGAVFATSHGAHQATWVMVDHRPDGVRYARIVHGMTAGIVAIPTRSSHPGEIGLSRGGSHATVSLALAARS